MILIAKNIYLQANIKAKEIWVSAAGEIIIIADRFGPHSHVPYLCLDYLESLCSQFYYSSLTHRNAIASILLLNGYIRANQYDEFYDRLSNTIESENYTVIYSELLQ